MGVPLGFQFSAVACEIRKKDRLDLGLIFCPGKGVSAGVFTKNSVKAAPVILGKRLLKNPVTRAILVNSGVANACTGEEGLQRAELLLRELALVLNIKREEILPASTGVIGEPLPLDRIIPKLPELRENLSEENYLSFAQAIMTTDTFPKLAFRKTTEGINILGIAKGAGMIAPQMATMLAFVLTDAQIGKGDLNHCLSRAVEESFNRITVDGDTSTNDTVYALASNQREMRDWEEFSALFVEVLQDLARLIVKDGEGASKVIKVQIKGAKTKEEAKVFAKAVAESLLVKTAFYGEDPNWGRIFAALGKTQIPFEPSEVELYLNGLPWIKNLTPQREERLLKKEMSREEIDLVIKLKRGRQNYWLWTCDLTEEYIKINASYRS